MGHDVLPVHYKDSSLHLRGTGDATLARLLGVGQLLFPRSFCFLTESLLLQPEPTLIGGQIPPPRPIIGTSQIVEGC